MFVCVKGKSAKDELVHVGERLFFKLICSLESSKNIFILKEGGKECFPHGTIDLKLQPECPTPKPARFNKHFVITTIKEHYNLVIFLSMCCHALEDEGANQG